MRYLGGKHKIGSTIAYYLNSIRKPNQPYLEPFCGGLNVSVFINGPKFLSDYSQSLIILYKSLQNGWMPPDEVSELIYNRYKLFPNPQDPMTAFCGYGCSFGGKWFGGFGRDGKSKRNFASESKRNLMNKFQYLNEAHFYWSNYKWINVTPGSLIYCDPPYEDTTNYGEFKGFDNEEFWDVMRQWSKENTVLVSEYKAPKDFVSIMEFDTFKSVSLGKRDKVTEHLFVMKGKK